MQVKRPVELAFPKAAQEPFPTNLLSVTSLSGPGIQIRGGKGKWSRGYDSRRDRRSIKTVTTRNSGAHLARNEVPGVSEPELDVR